MKSYSKLLTLLFVFSLSFSPEKELRSQDASNLVPNPSFEEKNGRLRRAGQIPKAKGWVHGNGGDADLFTTEDDDDEIGAPETYRGRCKPRTGNRFAGIRAYSYRGDEPRTYISAALPEEMGQGVLYCVKFYLQLSPLSKFAVNNVGAYLSKEDISTTEEKSLIHETELVHPKKKIHKNTRLWEPVCAAYKAKGGEKYITIGSFVKESQFRTERMRRPRRYNKSQEFDSYYFIDDVSVVAIDDRTECQCYKENEDDEPKNVFSSQVDVPDEATPKQEIEGRPVYFAYFSHDVESSFKKRLDEVASFMKENSGLSVTIKGHSDQKEAEEVEDTQREDVSLKRAESVAEYLRKKGVDEGRLNIEAMQASDLQSKGKSDYLRSKNRRVTFEVQRSETEEGSDGDEEGSEGNEEGSEGNGEGSEGDEEGGSSDD